MKIYVLFFFLVSFSLTSANQPAKDTTQVLKELNAATDSVKTGNYSYALKVAKDNIPFCQQPSSIHILAKCYRVAAGAFDRLAQADSAIIYFRKAMAIYIATKNRKQEAQCYHNIASTLYSRGEYENSLKNYIEAIKIREEIKDIIGLAWSQNNVGNIYWYQKAYDDALSHYLEARELFGYKKYLEGLGLTTGNMALIYETKGDKEKALQFFKEAIKVNEQSGNEIALAGNLCNIGSLYFRENNYDKARECYNRALEINTRLNNYHGLSLTYGGLAALCDVDKDIDCAERWILKAIENNTISGEKQANVLSYRNLASIYYQKKKYREAFDALDRSYGLNDSVNTGDKLAEIEASYGKEKREKEIQLLKQENEIKELDLKQKQIIIYASVIVAVLVVITGAIFIRNYNQKKKANKLLEEKNQEINAQKDIIETKQKEVLDSIQYAKKIQSALIENQELLKANFADSFVFFKPKDIVSGDFYYTAQTQNRFYLAVCDSTGHGVPGAFMSLLNTSFLSEAINEKQIVEPNLILNYVRERLIYSVSKDGSQDGMDAILFCFEFGANRQLSGITYSAANNRPLLVSDGHQQELAIDKMPVGKGVKNEPFKLFNVNVNKGDLLYLYTDGYADQFGGPKGKKFKYKQLNSLLLSLSSLSLNEQHKKLEETFDHWKGSLEQIDDVCVIGIRL